jgi:ribosomal protein S21
MKHRRENGVGRVGSVRITFEMLPKSVQRAGKDKQLEVFKRMFKRACTQSGLLRELREREYYVKPGEKKRRAKLLKKAAARGEIQQVEDYDKEPRYFDEYNY